MTSTVAAVVVAAVAPKQKEEKVNQIINQKEKDKHFKNHFI
jgi:hypothetical protein